MVGGLFHGLRDQRRSRRRLLHPWLQAFAPSGLQSSVPENSVEKRISTPAGVVDALIIRAILSPLPGRGTSGRSFHGFSLDAAMNGGIKFHPWQQAFAPPGPRSGRSWTRGNDPPVLRDFMTRCSNLVMQRMPGSRSPCDGQWSCMRWFRMPVAGADAATG